MKRKLVPLVARVRREHPHVVDMLDILIATGRVRVGGVPITNVRALVDAHTHLEIVDEAPPLRGAIKLAHALDAFAIDVAGRTCLDVGASTGGFTTTLLERGARRVYAVDVGRAQLHERLRLDARVVNLERTNLALLDHERVPEPIDVVTVDLSYLSLANALPQLARVLTRGIRLDLVLLVKPMFELALSSPPADDDVVAHDEAIRRACIAAEAMGACVVSTMRSHVTGARGATEHFVHARRA